MDRASDNTIMSALRQHFRQQLMPRNKGLIGITEIETGFTISLGQHQPFMVIRFAETTIDLMVDYPAEVKELMRRDRPFAQIKPFSKNAKKRKTELESIKLARKAEEATTKLVRCLTEFSGYTHLVTFDIFKPDSVGRIEFFMHTIISKVKYLVTNKGWYGIVPKEGVELVNLLGVAEMEYKKKVLNKS